jgi:hypothetical protein
VSPRWVDIAYAALAPATSTVSTASGSIGGDRTFGPRL